MLEFNWGFVGTIINLLILYFLLKKFLFQPVNNIIAKREKMVQDQLSGAKNTEMKALAMKEQYEATLAAAGEEAESIMNRAREQGKKEYDVILKHADEDTKRMVKEAKREIEVDRDRSMRQLSSEIAGLAVAAAEKAVGRQSGSFDEVLMNEFLKEEGALDE